MITKVFDSEQNIYEAQLFRFDPTSNDSIKYLTVLSKYSPDRGKFWSKEITNSQKNGSSGVELAVDIHDQIIVAFTDLEKLSLKKYSQSGEEIWTKEYDSYHSVKELYVFNNELYLLTINVVPNSDPPDETHYLIKYDSSGEFVWRLEPVNAPIVFDGKGNIYSRIDCKIDADGNYIWKNSGLSLWGAHTILTPNDEIFASGVVINENGLEYVTTKLSIDGKIKWYKIFTTADYMNTNETVTNMKLDKNNNIYITGYSKYHSYTVKYDSLGNEIYNFKLSDGEFEKFKTQQIYIYNESLFLTGYTDTGIFIAKIKDAVISDIDLESTSITDYRLKQNYPNPFNPTTTIEYSLSQSGWVKLTVSDLLGKEVAVLVNQEQAIGNYKVEFDATQLTSGIYFYTMQSEDFSETRKLLLLK